jgi:hypothetical protein
LGVAVDYPPHGRARSWAAVGVIILGFLTGGIALTAGPVWWLFWTGAAVAAVGGLAALVSDILSDVVLDEPRVIEEEVHYRTVGREDERVRGGAHGETVSKPTSTDPSDGLHG